MNEKWFALCFTHEGTTVALSGVAREIAESGLNPDDFLGLQIWHHLPAGDQIKSQDALARCIFRGQTQVVEIESDLGGRNQRWRTTYIKCQRPAEVLAITELLAEVPALTDTEVNTLSLLVNGCDTREIGESLGVDDQAVNQRFSRLRKKLGARTTAHLAVLAFKIGIR